MTSGNFGPPEGGQPPQGPPSFGEQPPPPGYGPPPGPPAGAPPGPPAGAPPGYGQQPPGGFGQQQYGQPMYGGGAPPPAPYVPARSTDAPGIVGIVVAVVAAALGVVAFTATNWFNFNGSTHFSDVHDVLDRVPGAAGLAKAYFGWLAWVLLAVGVIVAVVANLPSPASGPLRGLGVLVGLAGIAVTIFALKLGGSGDQDGLSYYIKHAAKAPSLYLAGGAFLLVAVASMMGPSRRR